MAHLLGHSPEVVVYCADPLDYIVLKPVLRHLPAIPFVTKNRQTAAFLKKQGINPQRMPSFPKAVIMCRHATHRFPDDRIVKIGFRHGPYHFKAFAKAHYYNSFDVYFMSSQRELEEARARGITSAQAIGFPKLDPAFDGTYSKETLDAFRREANVDPAKSTVMFTATWDRSGMSAIEMWIDELDSLAEHYNVLVTVHPWMSRKYIVKLRKLQAAHFIRHPNVVPFLLISDVLVGDTSSIIAEFCALDKPIINFKTPESERTVPEVSRLLRDISMQLEAAAELREAIERSLSDPRAKSEQRRKANAIMFDALDGRAGQRAAVAIRELVPSLRDEGW